jgi:hypothetical protein
VRRVAKISERVLWLIAQTMVIVGNPVNGRVRETVGFTLEGRLRCPLGTFATPSRAATEGSPYNANTYEMRVRPCRTPNSASSFAGSSTT